MTGPTGSTTVRLTATARTRAFDRTVRSSTGDPWLASVGTAEPVVPLLVPAGATSDITLTITPSARRGTVVRGSIGVLDWDARAGISGTRAEIPYRYRVG